MHRSEPAQRLSDRFRPTRVRYPNELVLRRAGMRE
jgi:hypothetical protein